MRAMMQKESLLKKQHFTVTVTGFADVQQNETYCTPITPI